ncbi:GNAT family N-acetyltransferase [Azospirillum soli]|uniref:GNAT family N-acetyltransferase n=1 Tax=Azospirillum soli TaxID=1304799 RepID=UPI001AE6D56F|nr:GNAT family N-acetyltransferase [Azospirillum soli]MBP2314302.1 GNAT superfamily N-acetyltransferase [Azospirillum soli]
MIRPVAAADLPELVELCRLHAAYEGAEYVDTGQADRLRAALFDTPPALYGWVADAAEGGGLDGYMTAVVEFATWPAQPFVYMDCLYLREGARGRGLGRRFMATLAAFARDGGYGEIQWQTPPDNALGIGFYRRIGARPRDKVRFFLDGPTLERLS